MFTYKNPQKPTKIFPDKRFNFIFSLCLIVGIIFSSTGAAQGNLSLLQKRVLFDGHKTTQILEFGNIGKDTATYVVSFLHWRMQENGSLLKISEPDSGELFADDYIRIYPHTIILAPNESQTLKVQLINTKDMKPGEYRLHLYFRAIRNGKEHKERSEENKDYLSISLSPLFGISIPVIIRIGKSTSSVRLTDLDLESQNDTSRVLRFSFRRSGNFSVYGDLSVVYVPLKGKETEIQKVRGLAVYTPRTIINSRLALKNKKGIDYHTGKLIVRYTKPDEEKGTILAQAELQLR